MGSITFTLLAPSSSSHAHCLCFAEQSKSWSNRGGVALMRSGARGCLSLESRILWQSWDLPISISSAGCLWGLVPAALNAVDWLGTSFSSRGPQWPPLSSVEALDESPLSYVVLRVQDEKTRTLPFWTWLWFNSHADAVHLVCVAWARLPRVSKMFVKFYSLLSKELESPKSFIELCPGYRALY